MAGKAEVLMSRGLLLTLASLAIASGCGDRSPTGVGGTGSGEASSFTQAANKAVAQNLPLTDAQDFEDARRGFIATDDPLVIPGPEGTPAWDFASYGFIEGDAPPTVNPSLWRPARCSGDLHAQPHGPLWRH
jgi:alkyl sulfatase BDS1-like metallo-beta-lactamase superfamily hydrolase